MTNTISAADKLVKVTLGITTLLFGESRVDAAKDIMAVITNGKALHADLTAKEHDIATALLDRAEKRFKALAGRPDFSPERLRTAKIHMDQALEHCIPTRETLAALDLDAERITEEMIETAIGALPEAEFAVFYASDDAEQRYSRRFFAEVTAPFLKELLSDRAVIDNMVPALWRDALETAHRTERKADEIKDDTAAIREMMKQLVAQSDSGVAQRQLEAQVKELEEKHAEDREAVVNLLKLLLDRHVPPEQWQSALADTERRAEELLASDYRIPNDATEREIELTGDARAALERRDFARAEELRREIRDLGRARRSDAVEMLAAQDAAETSEIAATVAASLDYQRASTLYAEATETPGLSTALQWRYQERRASVLDDLGREFGDNAALVEAIRRYREVVLPLAPRADRPNDWATTQMNLGNALQTLGGRESGTDRLEEAVAAYRLALEERTRDRVPLDWARTQMNLGTVYIAFFEKTGDSAHLDTAQSHTEAALEVFREANATQYIGVAEQQLDQIARLRSPD